MSRARPRFAPAAVFALAVPPESLPPDLRLRSAAWGALFAVTGRHTVAQIGASLGMDRRRLEDALAELLDRGLLRERTLSLDEYLAAAATVDDGASVTLSRFLRARGTAPSAAQVDAAVAESPASNAVDAAAFALPFEPLPLPEESAMPSEPALSLRALLQTLLDHAATPDAGQLDVYRTFLRVEPQLLQRNGITTLRLEDDRVVRDPELVRAIAASARQTLGMDLPAAVFVD